MKTCLFGGTFDPVHAGHMVMARAVEAAITPDRIVFMPAAQSPFKVGEDNLFTPRQRVTMLRAAVAGWAVAEVSEMDMLLPAPSWSWRLVEMWLKRNPADELYWLLGTDEWAELPRWSRWEYLAQNVIFAVYHRGEPPKPRPGVRALFLQGEQHPASATHIRSCLRSGRAVPQGWLPGAVENLARKYLEESASS